MAANNNVPIDWSTFDWNAITKYEDVPTSARHIEFGEGVIRHVVPNNVRIRLYDEWENRPGRGEWDDDFPMELFPDDPLPPASPPMDVPAGSEDVLFGDVLKDGDEIIDFQQEADKGRYYLVSSFNRITQPRKNPYTRQPIETSDIRKRSVHIVPSTAAGKRRKTKRRLRKPKTKKIGKSRKRIARK